MAAKASSKPATFDDCLAGATVPQRAVLEKLRKLIQTAAPDAEEGVSYGLAAFRLNGKPLVAIGASANHCALYLMNGSTVEAFKTELANHDTSKGTIRFPADKPLPAALVKKLVKARVAENAAKAGKPRAAKAGGAQADPAVAKFLADLDHPLKADIEAVRAIILSVSDQIREGVKWNAPSFRTTEFFATFHLRVKGAVRLVFHRGAKAKDNPKELKVADPAGMIQWLATDRAMVTVGAGKDIAKNRAALEGIVRAWIKQL